MVHCHVWLPEENFLAGKRVASCQLVRNPVYKSHTSCVPHTDGLEFITYKYMGYPIYMYIYKLVGIMVLITNHLAICFHDPPSPPKKGHGEPEAVSSMEVFKGKS